MTSDVKRDKAKLAISSLKRARTTSIEFKERYPPKKGKNALLSIAHF